MASKRRSLWIVALALLSAWVMVLGVGCRSISKEEVERRLLELPKNAPLRDSEIRRVSISVQGADGPMDLRCVYEPARSPGPAGSAPVVLVHGTPSTLCSWVEVIYGSDAFAGLRETRDVYALEIVGHGFAPGSMAPYTFQRCADSIVAAIRALGLERVHLVGHSYGGEFVWRAALDAPELLASVVLMDSSGYPRREGDFLPEEIEMRENSLARFGYLLNSRDRITTALAPHFDEIPPDRVEEFFLVCGNAANWRAMVDLARDENGERSAELAEFQPPTLVIWGADDVAYAADYYANRFDTDIPTSELRILEGLGHYPHEQDPGTVVENLEQFFERIDTAEDAP